MDRGFITIHKNHNSSVTSLQVYATNIFFFHETLFINEKCIYDYKCSWLNYLKIKIHITLSLPGKFLQKNHWHCIPYKSGQKFKHMIPEVTQLNSFLMSIPVKGFVGKSSKTLSFSKSIQRLFDVLCYVKPVVPPAPLEEKVPQNIKYMF